jgi:hypothetical protein
VNGIKGRGGRPRLGVLERRSIRLLLRLNPEEGSALRQAAERARLPLAQYIREAALGRPLVLIPEINREAFSSLARIGANLNQLAHHLNAGIPTPFPGPFPDLGELRVLLLAVRHGLLGWSRRKPPGDPEDSAQDDQPT